jgi:hypothetical protein
MKNYINNLFKLPGISFIFICNLKYQKRFLQKTLIADIDESRKTNDGSLDERDFNKMTDYYGYAVPAILGESYCLLRGKKLSSDERLALTCLGGLTGLFDDFFDKKILPESYIRDLVENPEMQNGNDSNERLFLKLYRKALDHSANADTLKKTFLKVFEAQVLSKKQISPDIKRKEIEEITFFKGGISLLFYRSIFMDNMSEEEEMLFYKLGSVMQLENDIFDVYKDYNDAVKTLVTTEKHIDTLRKEYGSLSSEIIDLAGKTDFPEKNIRKFLRIVMLVICRGFVCLDRLKKNEKTTDDEFSVESYNRKDLICDMEKPVNFFKTINYYAGYKLN